MRPAYLILQASLVVAGLFVYDQLRGGEPRSASEASPRENALEVLPPVRDETSEARIDALGRRIAALETRLELAAREPVARPANPRPADVPASQPPTLPDAGSIRVPPPAPLLDAQFPDDEIARFRGLLAVARRLEKAETKRREIARVLDRVPVTLTEQDRGSIVDESLRVWFRAETVRVARPSDGTTEAKTLRADYADAIGRIVQGSHADVIVNHMAPMLGLTATALSGRPPEAR